MCLRIFAVKKLEPIIASEDIVCYKILKLGLKNKWVTPCMSEPVSDDIIYEHKSLCAKGDEEIDHVVSKYSKNSGAYDIGGGFIHTYQLENDAKCQMDVWKIIINSMQIFKCVIPRGTKYYSGICASGFPCYASKEIKFVEQIEL